MRQIADGVDAVADEAHIGAVPAGTGAVHHHAVADQDVKHRNALR